MSNASVSSAVSEETESDRSVVLPTDAKKPFDSSARADIILRASDFVDFFVLGSILSIASPIFDNMFSLGKGDTNEKNIDEMKKGLPIVPLEEDSETLYNLLQLVYPYEEGPTELDVCARVAGAAQKYAMDGATRRLRKIVLTCDEMEKEPLKVFTVGAHLGWVDVIKQASLNTLSTPLRDLLCTQCKELQTTTAPDLSDLFTWRYACQDALRILFTEGRVGGVGMFLRRYLTERLEETSCPHSTALMEESVLTKVVEHLPRSHKEIKLASVALKKEIEERILRVPFKVRDIWIVQEPPRIRKVVINPFIRKIY